MRDLRHALRACRSALGQRACNYEALESRIVLSAADDNTPALFAASAATAAASGTVTYPGGVTVTPTQILTETEIIPRFVAQPTVINVRSGVWSDPNIWSTHKVPMSGDLVKIADNTRVAYNSFSNVDIKALEIDGTLSFSTTVNTRLIVGTTTVMPNGALIIGTASGKVMPNVKADFVIADQPLNLTQDPRQYGTGLLVLGTISMFGAPVVNAWVDLAAEPKAGDRSLLVSGDMTGWNPGESVVLPDTRQVLTTDSKAFSDGLLGYQTETVTIDHVVGNRVYLSTPLQFDHLGAHNTSGGLEVLPNVGLLTRNIVVHSQNPNGTRGHVFFNARANIDIEYAAFDNLGRTDAMVPLDNSTFDANGNVTHIGTNQVGRYAIHFHHVMGPVNPTNTGYQFEFIGNVISNAKKWAAAIHNSSYGLIEDNIVFKAQGAGFVTEDGSEVHNDFIHNFTIQIQGTYADGNSGLDVDDYGRGGSGFWFRRGGNNVIGNVAADSAYAGFVFDGYLSGDPIAAPNYRGADMDDPTATTMLDVSPAGTFVDNSAYGRSTYGLWAAFISGETNLLGAQPETIIEGLTLWNILNTAVLAYHTANVTYDNLLILGDEAAQNQNNEGTTGINLRTYENLNTKIINSRIEGVRYGIYTPKNDASMPGVERPTIIQNTILKNYANILVSVGDDDRPTSGNSIEIRDVKFSMITTLPKQGIPPGQVPGPANIRMMLWGDKPDLTERSVVRVYNYNQVQGDNFQVYYREQSPSYVLPQTTPGLLTRYGSDGTIVGSPVSGFNNLQNWLRYGIGIAGMAPTSAAASRPEIDGLIGPIKDLSTITPQLVLVTPWEGAVIPLGSTPTIRYTVNGNLPAGSQIYFTLDGKPFQTSGSYNKALFGAGVHVFRAWIGDAQGNLWPGTTSVLRPFTVLPGQLAQVNIKTTDDPGATSLSAVATALATSSTGNGSASTNSSPVTSSTSNSTAPMDGSLVDSALGNLATSNQSNSLVDDALTSALLQDDPADDLLAEITRVVIRTA